MAHDRKFDIESAFGELARSLNQLHGFLFHRLEEINYRLRVLTLGELHMANTLDAITEQVKANTDAEQSAVVLLGQLHDLLVQAGTDPAKLEELRNQLATSKEALAAAVVANTPSA